MILARYLVVFFLIFHINIFSQNDNNNIEFFKLLFELNSPKKKTDLTVELPGSYYNFSSGLKTRLYSFEKEFILQNKNSTNYKLIIERGDASIVDGTYSDQIMILINDEFINNKIYHEKNHEIDIPIKFFKKGVNKISLLVINNSNEGRINGDIYLYNKKRKIFLNGKWDFNSFNKYENNFIRRPTQGFDLLSFIDINIDKYTSINLDDKNWQKTNFPIYVEELFNDVNINPAICFRKLIKFKSLPSEDYLFELNEGIDDYDRLYVNGKLIGSTDCFHCERKYLIPKQYLEKENIFTLFVIDKNGPGGVKGKITLSNSTDSINISDQWSYRKLLEMEMLITIKKFEKENSFYERSEFNFYNLLGTELNFETLLIEDRIDFNYYLMVFILVVSVIVFFIYFLSKKKNKVDKTQQSDSTDRKNFIIIRSERADHKILISDIILIEGKKDYVKVTIKEKSFLVRKNLKTFLIELPNSIFVRISKSTALNKEYIEKIEKNMLFLNNGNSYIIGKKYHNNIKELFKTK
jgi:hypothetical protein